MERAGKVVCHSTAVILLGHGHQARQPDQEQQQELERQSSSQDSEEEGRAPPRRLSLRRGGTWATSCGPGKRKWAVEYTKTLLQQRMPLGTQPPLKADLQFAQTLMDNYRGIFQRTCHFPNTFKRPRIFRLGRKTPNDDNRRGFVTPQPLYHLWGRLHLKHYAIEKGKIKGGPYLPYLFNACCLKRWAFLFKLASWIWFAEVSTFAYL